jgi:hypothetical protein
MHFQKKLQVARFDDACSLLIVVAIIITSVFDMHVSILCASRWWMGAQQIIPMLLHLEEESSSLVQSASNGKCITTESLDNILD